MCTATTDTPLLPGAEALVLRNSLAPGYVSSPCGDFLACLFFFNAGCNSPKWVALLHLKSTILEPNYKGLIGLTPSGPKGHQAPSFCPCLLPKATPDPASAPPGQGGCWALTQPAQADGCPPLSISGADPHTRPHSGPRPGAVSKGAPPSVLSRRSAPGWAIRCLFGCRKCLCVFKHFCRVF